MGANDSNAGRMPAMFVGHGSPLNGVEDNRFSKGWASMAATFPKPRAILCVSAHWISRGSRLSSSSKPKTIHDFGGFPGALYEVEYPAPGDPALAAETADALGLERGQALDGGRGLDHGAWTVLRRMYPDADIPVVQLSLDWDPGPAAHLALGRKLAPLRDKGVLIIGSGNVVHNLGLVDFGRLDDRDYGFEWAYAFDAAVKAAVVAGDDRFLVQPSGHEREAALAAPTPDHYYPLLYAAGARLPGDTVETFNEAAVAGSLTMTSYIFRTGA